jgi:F-type H+-transporting ATPase subunit delta
MTFVSEVAKRYAKALFDSISDKNQFGAILTELREFEKVLHENGDIGRFFESPLINSEQKVEVAKAAFSKIQLSEQVKNLAIVMAG